MKGVHKGPYKEQTPFNLVSHVPSEEHQGCATQPPPM